MLKHSLAALAGFTMLTVPVSMVHAQSIDTLSSWNGSNYASSWGAGATSTYGQTITAPTSNSTLLGFSFRIAGSNGSLVNNNYRAFVYAWNNSTSTITGNALYSSSVQSTGTVADNTPTPFSFATTVPLTAGNTYVLFLTTAGATQSGNSGVGKWAFSGTSAPGSDTYTGGNFVYINTPNFSSLSTTAWSDPSSFGGNATSDLAFTANIAAVVPEANTAALLGLALPMIGTVVVARRRTMKRQG